MTSDIVTVGQARKLFGKNFIGIEEIRSIVGLEFDFTNEIPMIFFSSDELESKKNEYLLILGRSRFSDGKAVTIRNMIDIFGKDPQINEPCFYNQDWYSNEKFIDKCLDDKWFLIRKKVYEDSRAVQPNVLAEIHNFPSAIQCTYAFFVTWLVTGAKLWDHDFVWCSDSDHNGDRIYVGKYHDVDGINKNGFNIHRHLEIRDFYGCID